MINAERSRDAQEDYTDALAQTSSLWHCKQLCDQYSDCTWFSWKRVVPDLNGELVVSCHHIAGGKCFECLMMKEVSAGSMAASLEVSPEWISSSTDCDRVQTQFSSNATLLMRESKNLYASDFQHILIQRVISILYVREIMPL